MTLKLVDPPTKPAPQPTGEIPNLRLNYHAAMLAVTLYCHYYQLYDLPEQSWVDLPGVEKQAWITRAADWLRDEAPAKCSMGCGRYVRPGHTYCDDPICQIDAERDR
jgi:hypothetical protein